MDDPRKKIRVILVDDSEVVRIGLRAVLEGTHDIEITGEAASVAQACASFSATRPDIVLLDLRLPDGSGLKACREILRMDPKARIIVLTSVADAGLIDDAVRSGAHGYLLKEIDAEGLVWSIREIASGKSILDPHVTTRVLALAKSGGVDNALNKLSAQEQRVLALIAAGKTNKEVGVELGLSEKTVKNYLSNVFEKLNVSRRAEAAALFVSMKPKSMP